MATEDDIDLEYQPSTCCGSETCPPGYEEGSPCRTRWNWGIAVTFGPVWILYVVWIINDTKTATFVAVRAWWLGVSLCVIAPAARGLMPWCPRRLALRW